MPATIEQATTNGTKVMDRLMAQGRPHHEAARDAARWVWDNMGLVVTLDQKEGLEFCGACHTYRTAGSVCHTCHTRMQDLFNRYERERRQARERDPLVAERRQWRRKAQPCSPEGRSGPEEVQ